MIRTTALLTAFTLSLLTLSPRARAEEPAPARPLVAAPNALAAQLTTPMPADPGTQARYESGRKMRLAGIILTAIGTVGVATGIGMYAYGRSINENDPGYEVTGIFVALLGAAPLVTGAVLWPVGQARMSSAIQLGATNVSLGPAPAGSMGGSLGFSF